MAQHADSWLDAGAEHASEGVKSTLKGMALLLTGQPMNEPITQVRSAAKELAMHLKMCPQYRRVKRSHTHDNEVFLSVLHERCIREG
jgi:hypothetical protein